MAAEIKTIRGLKVEKWKTSFRVEGMSGVIMVESNLSWGTVEMFVEAIYDGVYKTIKDRAIKQAVVEMTSNFERVLRGQD